MKSGLACVWALGALLGEGPIWTPADRSVWFVDIKQKRVHRYTPATGEQRSWDAPAEPGFLVPIAGGGFVAGLKTGLHRFDPARSTFTLLTTVEPPELGNRLNDGYADACGRLWFGSMHDPEREQTGALYRYANGRLTCMDEGYTVTNGPTVSPDGRTLYHVDSLQRVIYAFDLAADGSLSRRRVFAQLEKPGVYPDGPIVDVEGCIWIGLYGGWSMARYSPRGELIGQIRLPCANVTKAAFGGNELRTLYIATARQGLSEQEKRAQPLAGALFEFEVDTPGLPANEVRLG
jgi:sugar lactone lactonase YvrE